MIKPKAKTVAEKPAYRAAYKQRRCLLPADGCYEWKKLGRTKQPTLFRQRDGLFAFAGLRESWRGREGAGNRRAKQTHIGEQNGPTWVQGYTSRNERPLLVPGRCSCSAWA